MIDDSDQHVLGVRWVEEGLEKGLGFCVGGGWAGERARGRRFFSVGIWVWVVPGSSPVVTMFRSVSWLDLDVLDWASSMRLLVASTRVLCGCRGLVAIFFGI